LRYILFCVSHHAPVRVNDCKFALGSEIANLRGRADPRSWGPRFFSSKNRKSPKQGAALGFGSVNVRKSRRPPRTRVGASRPLAELVAKLRQQERTSPSREVSCLKQEPKQHRGWRRSAAPDPSCRRPLARPKASPVSRAQSVSRRINRRIHTNQCMRHPRLLTATL